jgi:enamine deaminase RidA (YjgF/YER057c/UK114 family)
MDLHQTLKGLQLELPSAVNPGGNYVSVNVRGQVAYVAIQFPMRNGTYLHQGRLGAELGLQQGYEAFQLCALNVLAQLEAKLGMHRLLGMNHMDAYYRATEEWDEAPKAVNGASDLFVNALGEKGTHTRAIFGVHHLPRDFAVGITTSFTLLP